MDAQATPTGAPGSRYRTSLSAILSAVWRAGWVNRADLELVAISSLFALSVLLAAGFFLFKNHTFFDDSFIYLHIAANIAETGTARYFPIAESEMLLASSPLKLLTLAPAFLILEAFGEPLRTLDAAKFAFLSSGIVGYWVFLPFWTNKVRTYLLLGAGYFLLSASLSSLFLMEGGVLLLSLFTLLKLIGERTQNYFAIGIALLLVGLSRPEIGVIAIICTALAYCPDHKQLMRIAIGLGCSFLLYWLLMVALDVYPIPSTIWSKQLTGKLRLFSEQNLIGVLPASIAELLGVKWTWMSWILIALPIGFSALLGRGAIPVVAAVSLLLLMAIPMPGNFAWYSQNFFVVLLALMTMVVVEIYRKQMLKSAATLAAAVAIIFSLTLASNFGKNRVYPWNENSPGYLAYEAIAKSAIGEGKYLISRYSKDPVRIRMCEIGIVSFLSGPKAWIYDLCGLIQIGNLKDASSSSLRHFYPVSFAESGDEQLARFKDLPPIPVVDVWGLRSKEEIEGAQGKCKFSDHMFCINEFR